MRFDSEFISELQFFFFNFVSLLYIGYSAEKEYPLCFNNTIYTVTLGNFKVSAVVMLLILEDQFDAVTL